MKPVLIFFCLALTSIYADTLHLKNGDSVEGFYQSEDANGVTFVKADGDKITVAADDLDRIDFSSTGTPACYKTKDQKEVCDALLNSAKKDEIVVAQGPERRTEQTVKSQNITSISLRKVAPHQKVAAYLIEGKNAKVKTADGQEVAGRIVESSDSQVKIRDAQGKETVIQDSDIKAADMDMRETKLLTLRNLVIGLPQVTAGRKRVGYSMMGGMGVLGLGFTMEYLSAVKDNQKAKSDPTVILFNNTSYFESFKKHQQNQLIFAMGAGLLYGYHWLDLYLHRGDSGPGLAGGFIIPSFSASSSRGSSFEGSGFKGSINRRISPGIEAGLFFRF